MDSTYYDFSSNSNISTEESLKIPWAREVEPADAQILEMVILMSPADQTNLWNAEFKVNLPACSTVKQITSGTSGNELIRIFFVG